MANEARDEWPRIQLKVEEANKQRDMSYYTKQLVY